MLPSRPRLQSWNPDALATAAPSVDSGGAAIYHAVRNLEDGIDRMPESRAWQGQAHTAATGMFRRATDAASKFKDYTEKVAAAMKSGSGSIAAARKALLDEADRIDQGELHVSDQWVVLIKAARVSAEKAASLQEAARKAQAEVNHLLAAVGQADEKTAADIQQAAKSYGFVPLDPRNPSVALSGLGPPGDEVPDPSSPFGMQQQEMLRSQDMATTIREVREWTSVDGHEHKTLTMMDGSRHEISIIPEDVARREFPDSEAAESVSDVYYDKNGKLVYKSSSLGPTYPDNKKVTEIDYADGTVLTMSDVDGKTTGGVTTPDGRHGVLPEEFFTHPVATSVGGVATGVQTYAEGVLKERGGQIPWMTAQSLEDVAHGSHFGGLGLGVVTTLYDMSNAESKHEMCVAGVEGVSGTIGGELGGGVAAGASGPLAPIVAAGGVVAGTWIFGAAGHVIGEAVCPQ